jgi:hypothetical protein
MLNHVRGATSLEDTRTWHGITYDSFRGATEARGFVDTDKSLDECLSECALVRFPHALRRLFATIMIFCECTNLHFLWDKHFDSLSEDFSRDNNNKVVIEQMVLRDISFHLMSMGKKLKHYGLPKFQDLGNTITTSQFLCMLYFFTNKYLL